MKCSLGISNFLEKISSLSHSVVFLYFFFFLYFLIFFPFFVFFYFTILYWFCHTSTWIRHGCTRVPHPEHAPLPPCTITLGHPSAPAPSILYPASNLDGHLLFAWSYNCHLLGFIFGFLFFDILLSLNAITNHLWNLHSWPEIKPEPLEWEHWLQDPKTTWELTLGRIK